MSENIRHKDKVDSAFAAIVDAGERARAYRLEVAPGGAVYSCTEFAVRVISEGLR